MLQGFEALWELQEPSSYSLLFWYNKKTFLSYSFWFHGLVGFATKWWNSVSAFQFLSYRKDNADSNYHIQTAFILFKSPCSLAVFLHQFISSVFCIYFYTATTHNFLKNLLQTKSCAFRKLTRNLMPFKQDGTTICDWQLDH